MISIDLFYPALFFVIVLSISMLFFAGSLTEASRFYLSLFITLIVALFFGVRGDDVGIDSYQYARLYEGFTRRSDIEPLFFVLIFSTSPFYSYTSFFVFVSILINLGYFYSFRVIERRYYFLCLSLLFSSFLFLNSNVSMVRQGLSISLAFLAFSIFYKRSFSFSFSSVFVYLLSVTAHYSALVLLPLFLYGKIRLRRWHFFPILSLVFFFFNFDITIITSYFWSYGGLVQKLHWYLTWPHLTEWSLKHFYYVVLFFYCLVFFVFFFKRGFLYFDGIDFFIKVFLYSLLVLSVFHRDEMLADRLFYYFIPFILVAFVKFFVRVNFGFKYFVLFFLLILWFLKSYYQFYTWFISGSAIGI